MHAFYHGFFCRTIAFALLCVLLHFILHSHAAWLKPPSCKGPGPDSTVFPKGLGLRPSRLPYRVPTKICSFNIRLHIFFLEKDIRNFLTIIIP